MAKPGPTELAVLIQLEAAANKLEGQAKEIGQSAGVPQPTMQQTLRRVIRALFKHADKKPTKEEETAYILQMEERRKENPFQPILN